MSARQDSSRTYTGAIDQARGCEALVIPVAGPVRAIELGAVDGDLAMLQEAVGGFIEALPLPDFIADGDLATAYVNEEGKLRQLDVNWRATDFMVPGVGLFFGDFIAGPMVVAGFNPRTGSHAPLPPAVESRVRLVQREAAGR